MCHAHKWDCPGEAEWRAQMEDAGVSRILKSVRDGQDYYWDLKYLRATHWGEDLVRGFRYRPKAALAQADFRLPLQVLRPFRGVSLPILHL